MRRGLLAVACTLALASGAGAQEELDAFVAEQMRAQRIPGLAVAIVQDGEIIVAKGYGFADVAAQTPVTPETVFRIASVSKQIIAAGVLRLVDDGRVRLDDPIGRWLEGAPASWDGITVRHLLTHTSGLVRESPGFRADRLQPEAEVIRAAYDLPLRFQPGEKWEYSNLGYFILAEIITRASGLPWSTFLVEEMFLPLGMTSTRASHDRGELDGIAQGYRDNDAWNEAPDFIAARPSGAFFSTVLDLAKWEAALHDGSLLSDSTLAQAWTPVRLNDGSTYDYGFGWQLSTVLGRRAVHHGGGMPGARAYYLRFPDDGLAVIVLMNLDDVDPVAIVNRIAELYLYDG